VRGYCVWGRVDVGILQLMSWVCGVGGVGARSRRGKFLSALEIVLLMSSRYRLVGEGQAFCGRWRCRYIDLRMTYVVSAVVA
jgi:hypothetical protein